MEKRQEIWKKGKELKRKRKLKRKNRTDFEVYGKKIIERIEFRDENEY